MIVKYDSFEWPNWKGRLFLKRRVTMAVNKTTVQCRSSLDRLDRLLSGNTSYINTDNKRMAEIRQKSHQLTFECDDFTGGVHDCGVSWDWSSDGVCRVIQVNNNDLRRFADLLAHADELVWLHRQRAEPDVGRIDAEVLQLLHANHEWRFCSQCKTVHSPYAGLAW